MGNGYFQTFVSLSSSASANKKNRIKYRLYSFRLHEAQITKSSQAKQEQKLISAFFNELTEKNTLLVTALGHIG
jgi:capsule polysaccharide export protein KpsE/RkpR